METGAAVQTAVRTDPVVVRNSGAYCQPAPTHHDHHNRALASLWSRAEKQNMRILMFRNNKLFLGQNQINKHSPHQFGRDNGFQ